MTIMREMFGERGPDPVSVRDNPLLALEWMKQHGSALSLDWGEDTDLWECSWISAGNRYTGIDGQLATAIYVSLRQAFRATEPKQMAHPAMSRYFCPHCQYYAAVTMVAPGAPRVCPECGTGLRYDDPLKGDRS